MTSQPIANQFVTTPNSVQVSFTYDEGGRLSRITDPGSYVEYVYNARNWITDVRNRTTGGTSRYDAAYYYNDGTTWDNVGNPLKRTENIAGSTYTTTLRYDAVYRRNRGNRGQSPIFLTARALPAILCPCHGLLASSCREFRTTLPSAGTTARACSL